LAAGPVRVSAVRVVGRASGVAPAAAPRPSTSRPGPPGRMWPLVLAFCRPCLSPATAPFTHILSLSLYPSFSPSPLSLQPTPSTGIPAVCGVAFRFRIAAAAPAHAAGACRRRCGCRRHAALNNDHRNGPGGPKQESRLFYGDSVKLVVCVGPGTRATPRPPGTRVWAGPLTGGGRYTHTMVGSCSSSWREERDNERENERERGRERERERERERAATPW
jgi:hypothetical protein